MRSCNWFLCASYSGERCAQYTWMEEPRTLFVDSEGRVAAKHPGVRGFEFYA
jgi:hypothetical protein